MSRVLALVGLMLVVGLGILLFLLQSRTAKVEPATIVRETEEVDDCGSATFSGPEAAEIGLPRPNPEPPRQDAEPSTALPSTASTTFAALIGTVTGRVVFSGEVPTMKPLVIPDAASRGCCAPGQSVDTTNRSLLVGEMNGIANVVVTITVKGMEATPLLDPIYLDQTGCHFEPHVSVIPTGTTVIFRNLDQIEHNVHTFAIENDSFNRTIEPSVEYEQKLARKECIEVRCDIHPWMRSWLVIVDTPYFAVTDFSGSFAIKDLPVGKHKVDVWHELLVKSEGIATAGHRGRGRGDRDQIGGAEALG